MKIYSVKVAYVCAFVLAVVATSFATPPYSQPGRGGCSHRIIFLHFVVLVMGCDCAQGIYLLFVGSNHRCFGGCRILPGISNIRNSVLGYGRKLSFASILTIF